MRRLRKLLILVLMLILPLQGLAAAYAPMLTMMDGPSATAKPCHDAHAQQEADRASSAGHTSTGAGHDTDSTSHLCCHHVFTGISTGTVTSAAHKFSDVSRFIFPLVTLFIPDSPDRPPRG
jgi:hypothetical protein